MSDIETRYHEAWLGMVQPTEGLVVSVPVLVDAQCLKRQPPATQARLLDLCPPVAGLLAGGGGGDASGPRRIAELATFLADLLELTPDLLDVGVAIPDDLSLYVPEGRQTLRPTLALRKLAAADAAREAADATPDAADSTPASRAGAAYLALVWDLPDGLDLDKSETATGPWDYPPAAKFDRLLRQTRVPIGLLTNRRVVRLVYAPHGESSGSITFRIDDMATVGGRPILDAFVMLLGATRWFGVAREQQLPAILAASRKRQANVTNALAAQVFEALEVLLAGFEAAAERDGRKLLDDALARDDDHLYGGLLTVLLRLVFVLYAEDRGLLPVENETYSEHLAVLALHDQLRDDYGAFPDSMALRFGAWGRLVTLFRAVFLGVEHGDLRMPPRRGQLFDPHLFPFLEGWGPVGSSPLTIPEHRAAVDVPTVDDETIFRVLEKLLVFEGHRLSYRALDVEQIGSVYEALMGYHVIRVDAAAVCLRPARVWLTVEEVRASPAARRAKWLKETAGLATAHAKKLAEALKDVVKRSGAGADDPLLDLLDDFRVKGTRRARAGQLVIQPGSERRRTSSHYTPRSLSAPIVERTLEPLLKVMGDAPPSARILDLKICDPAMGSGAFLVEACRQLADQVVAAWTREGKLELIASAHEDVVNHARRLVAQRCLYGVDRNQFAVNLAKLSLWLVTLAKDEPFTFVDHALRHGDSLVGLDFEQVKSFHWQPGQQLELCRDALTQALDDAVDLRKQILTLAEESGPGIAREKERLLADAEDALERVRLIGDLVVGAFFSSTKPKEREAERSRRLVQVTEWLRSDGPIPSELREMQAAIQARLPVFHWMSEFPEVFYIERPDPLDGGKVNGAAWMDGFVGNPPFMGQSHISGSLGDEYRDWLFASHKGTSGKSDYCAHFFRRSAALLGNHGTIGLIATNTIAQGDTRLGSLQHLLAQGHEIYSAHKSMPWPGEAAVAVAVVHLAHGRPAEAIAARGRTLDGLSVSTISSRLRPTRERPDPVSLGANSGLSFLGCKIGGQGFLLSPEQRDDLVRLDPRNAERIHQYLGGEEVNTSPTQSPDRLVIDFAQLSEAEAGKWPELLAIVREHVKPYRDSVRRDAARKRWWQFGEVYPAMREAIRPLFRCLVTSRVTKHLCFSFQPTTRVLNERLYVFPFDTHTPIAILQSRIHDAWTRLLSSTLEDRLNYSATDCFETFPFPQSDPRTLIPELEELGARLYDRRAAYMVATDQGLTKTYNRLKDPTADDPEIHELRTLHEDLDRAVLRAYGWDDIPVPPYPTPTTATEQQALATFEDEVIDRLFVLNQKRAAEEKQSVKPKKKPTKPRKKKEEQGPLLPME